MVSHLHSRMMPRTVPDTSSKRWAGCEPRRRTPNRERERATVKPLRGYTDRVFVELSFGSDPNYCDQLFFIDGVRHVLRQRMVSA